MAMRPYSFGPEEPVPGMQRMGSSGGFSSEAGGAPRQFDVGQLRSGGQPIQPSPAAPPPQPYTGILTGFASPEQKQAYQDYIPSMGGPQGLLQKGLSSAYGAQGQALGYLRGQDDQIGMLNAYKADPGMLDPSKFGQAQTQFSIGGAPTNLQQAQGQTFTAQRPGELTTAMQGLQGFTPDQSVTQAQQNLAGVMGGLGAFTQGAGSGQSAATLAQSAALGKMQETSMANALGQLREQGFTGAATAGGMGNLASMAAAQSAGQFAQQRAGLLESERQAALQAAGMQGQFAQGMGQLGLGAGQQRLGALTSMGGLASDEAGRMLTAQTETGRQGLMATQMNQDAALRSAQLAQQGDIAGAELALKGTGMNMNQALQIAQSNQSAGLQAQGLNLNALQSAGQLNMQQAQGMADIASRDPYQNMIAQYLQFGQQLSPYQGILGYPPRGESTSEEAGRWVDIAGRGIKAVGSVL